MIGWLDVSAGVSGDMLLAAVVDAGVPVAVLRDAVAAVVPDVALDVATVQRGGLRATKVDVVVSEHEQPQRRLADIETLLTPLDQMVRDGARAVFTRLAAAEAAVHGVGIEEVHFHEVGALDAIADVVGVVAGFTWLGLTAVSAGPLGLGAGRVSAAHGALPVPAPAVVELARGIPVTAGPASFEAATPTGVALLRQFVGSWRGLEPMTIERVGVGAGGHDPATHPNVVRLVLGEGVWPEAHAPGLPTETAYVLEANLDDMDPRLWPGVIDALLAAGAVDAWVTPIVMKKGRPAMTLSALAPAAALGAVERACLRTSTTIGLRVREVSKVALPRTSTHVKLDGHRIAVKVATLDGVEVNRSVEWDDVAAAAAALGRPPKDVLAAAEALAREL